MNFIFILSLLHFRRGNFSRFQPKEGYQAPIEQVKRLSTYF